ncbi:MAG: hypothetical protein CVV07_01090 [Gammaproteobacteria bacterium HGW-Gammaproteobacteria-11]|nr:MAG: hypothetical protein CVV07_01090 [Gammaproteobacteria bacterium HGW-Gammaproteobacteria-11]
MKTKPAHLIAVAPCSFQMPSQADGNLVRIQVTPAGLFQPADGRPLDVPGWYIDAATAQVVIERFNARRQPLVIDYDHQTLNKEKNGQPAPAAGWFKGLEWDDQGLWAVAELTDRAMESRAKREYMYFSPVFGYDGTTGVVQELHMGALTNTPAVHGMEGIALIAAATFGHYQPEDVSVDKLLVALIAALGLAENATPDQAVAALNARLTADPLSDLRKALKLDDKADQATIVTACSALMQKAATADPAQFVPVAAVQQLQGEVAALSARLQARDEVDTNTLINAAIEDGRLAKALEPWARDLAKTNVAALNSYLDAATPLSVLLSSQTKGQHIADDGTGLTQDELAVCSQLNLTAEQFKAAKGA